MQNTFLIEELAANDSFINYCHNRNQEDITCWENYLLLFPDQRNNIEAARNLVLGIAQMFREKEYERALSELKADVWLKYNTEKEQTLFYLENRQTAPKQAVWKYAGYAAAAVAALTGLFLFLQPAKLKENRQVPEHAVVITAAESVYKTNYREKKVIWLPDSSKVTLNAMSTLKTGEGFGITNRTVYLTGEALFDVAHNKKIPFTVNMPSFDVKVLGTLFNIKAYPEDKTQETSLIRGSVEVIIKNRKNSNLFLKPNEKAIIPNAETPQDAARQKKNSHAPVGLQEPVPTVIPLTISSGDSSIIETSWVYNRLDIYNKKFSEIKTDLERLYNVNINFKDSKVANYRFSATFADETIEQVLQALQLSYHFHYVMENNTITLSK
ncbi:FecR family protein [Agriterribacter sp.]|uniref:FecR family protein n=1 Tax=Agriterribacter sp. TaxID=2821509 RepID=UPI002B91EDA1|nr:FecR family protein [Agriterribacter sp.]HTN07729.1 FecR family protein [Agriterribacter sp.]